jgi:hypothetical protein
MRYPVFYVTPKPDGSFHLVSQRPVIGLFRAVCAERARYGEAQEVVI